jgi:hypothetical protein
MISRESWTVEELRAKAAELRREGTNYRLAGSNERDPMVSNRFSELAAECARLADIMEEEATAKESDDVQTGR